MRAVVCSGHGDVSVLKIESVEPPHLGSGEVRIRVRASGVNRADLLQRRGLYPPPPGTSELLGLEVAGEITEVAPDVRMHRPGDRVMALLAGGGYAEEVVVDHGLVLPLPGSWSFVEGAATLEVFITAHRNLYTLGRIDTGRRALVHAGASGVGTAAIQLLRASGKTAFATVGSAAKAEACRALGAIPIEYKRESFAEVVGRDTSGEGVDVILDPVGAQYLASDLQCLATDGRLVLIGLMSGRKAEIDLGVVLAKRLSILGSTLRSLPLQTKRDSVQTFWQHAEALIAAGRLKPLIDRVLPAAQVRDAHVRMEANENIGKIVLTWE